MKPYRQIVSLLILFGVILGSAATALGQKAGKLDETRAMALARDIERGMNKGDPKALLDVYDTQAMMEKTLAGLTLTPKLRAEITAGGKQAIEQMCVVIGEQLKKGGTYKLLRVRMVAGEPRPLFRLNTKQGLNYHEFPLRLDETGKVRVVDVVVYATGEPMSLTLRRVFIPFIVRENRSILDKLMRSESEYIKHADEVVRFMKIAREGPAEDAVKLYRSWPAELQGDQNMMFFYVMACGKLDGKSYLAAIEGFQKAFPSAPNCELLGLDSFFLKKEWAKLLTTVDALEKRLGGDPYLAIYRGQALAGQGNVKEGLASLVKASGEEPTLPDLHWVAITVALNHQLWGDVSEHLNALERDCKMHIKDLTTIPLYAEYVKTAEYKKWLADREK